MKYLEVNSLDQINAALAAAQSSELRLSGRIEAYSCKTVGEDKRLYKTLEARWAGDEYEDELSIVSPFGPLDQHASRKTLFYLIATLNASFPDYDFRDVRASQFSKQQSLPMVANSINTSLANIGPHAAELTAQLWHAIDAEINLAESDIYMFHPDPDSDPYTDASIPSLWSFHYFFYNKKLKRIIFLTCNAQNMFDTPASRSGYDTASSDQLDYRSSDGEFVGDFEGIPSSSDESLPRGWMRFDDISFRALG